MKPRNIPMTIAEYEAMASPFGWKVEYWDGQAHFTPRGIGVTTRIDLTSDALPPRNSRLPHTLVPVDACHAEQMTAGYVEVFSASVEFCGWPLADIEQSAQRDIRHYFSGERGGSLPASVIALAPDSQQLAGLALFILKQNQKPHLELLYVKSQFQRQGIATAMVRSGIDSLINAGFNELFSTYHVCNLDSQQWHHQFGFQDIYDAYYVRLRIGWLNREIWRREKLEIVEGLNALVEERDHWQSELDAGKHQYGDEF
ncbi:MAG: GNAT family N-acetyltransferase [Cyanobacteria bacterium J06648_16]